MILSVTVEPHDTDDLQEGDASRMAGCGETAAVRVLKEAGPARNWRE